MRKKLLVKPALCVHCRICEMACSLSKVGMFSPVKSRIWIHRNEDLVDTPIVCRQCTSPPCEKACPVGAIFRSNDDGTVRISYDKCIGCYECATACPFGAIRVDPETGDVIKCDLCGGDPECAKWCPTGSVKFVEQGTIGTYNVEAKPRKHS